MRHVVADILTLYCTNLTQQGIAKHPFARDEIRDRS